MTPAPGLQETLEASLQTLSAPHRYFPAALRRFLSYLQTEFPHVRQFSDLRRDPHLLGWARQLGQQNPPLTIYSRRIYLSTLRRLFSVAEQNSSAPRELILPEDFPGRPCFPRPPRMSGPSSALGEIFEAQIQTLTAPMRSCTLECYRAAAYSFLSCLEQQFPDLQQLSALRRDPHVLAWLQILYRRERPLSSGTRETYLYKVRHILQELAAAGHISLLNLIGPEDFPRWPHQQLRRAELRLPQRPFGDLFEARIQTLATVLRSSTVAEYRSVAWHFLSFLQNQFPDLPQLALLRRDPHLCAWLRNLCQSDPPRSPTTRRHYLFVLRRLFEELALAGHPIPSGLILPQDFPPLPERLPRALSPEDDHLLQQELRRTDDLLSNALLLTRATGMRIGECIQMSLDPLRSLGPNQWALHIPLGKLYTERLVPIDQETHDILARLLSLRAQAPALFRIKSPDLLLPRSASPQTLYQDLNRALHQAAERAGCSHPVTCHQLRHTYATEMLRLGVSLPALMQLLGHKDVRMTMRYVHITLDDLQRQFHLARQSTLHHIPQLPLSPSWQPHTDLPSIRRTLAAARHLLEMFRRQLPDELTRRKLHRLDKRLHSVCSDLDHLTIPAK